MSKHIVFITEKRHWSWTRQVAKAGHVVAFNGLADDAQIQAVVEELAALGASGCHYFDGDMRKPDEIRAMMAAAEAN